MLITSSGAEIIDILRAVDFDAKSQPRPLCPHRFETCDFEAMYPNLPDAALQEVIMRKLLEDTFKHQSQHGLFSIEIRWGFADDHTNPVVRHTSWSSEHPQHATIISKNYVWLGPAKIFQWLKFVLDKGVCAIWPPYV